MFRTGGIFNSIQVNKYEKKYKSQDAQDEEKEEKDCIVLYLQPVRGEGGESIASLPDLAVFDRKLVFLQA